MTGESIWFFCESI